MILAEFFKRPVGHKRVHDSQLASRNPDLYLGDGYAQKVGCPLPGVCAIPIYGGSRDSSDGGGVQRCTNLVAEYCQGACRYARISYPQHAASDEIRQSVLMYAQHLPQPPQRPPVGDLGTDP